MVKELVKGTQACITITHVDGLVLARSAFNHSMNYRSAMIYGVFEVVGSEQKAESMAAFMERIALGRQATVREGSYAELAGTTILRMPLVEFMCKTRSGGPNDDEEDMQQATWAGVLPLHVAHGTPVPHEKNTQTAPDYVSHWNS
jgi:nitroimidazol reductase NimA-like FMN-containing flavoprotein (pyridoxamine 5'-phosphate oxidase superfamily)